MKRWIQSILRALFKAQGAATPPKHSPRICARCKQTIRRRDKYFFKGSTIQHRDCDDPDGAAAADNSQGELLQ